MAAKRRGLDPERTGTSPYNTTYLNDPAGNRLQKVDSGQITTGLFNAANELVLLTPPTGPPTTIPGVRPPAPDRACALPIRSAARPEHSPGDANGNLSVEQTGAALTSYTWSGENRLLFVDSSAGRSSYLYSADGLRQSAIEPPGTPNSGKSHVEVDSPSAITPGELPPMYNPDNPLIVQSDRSVLLEVDNPRFEECRDQLAQFAELIKSPEHMHTYRITPLSLWNARAAGMPAADMTRVLTEYSKYDVPGSVLKDVREYVARYGRLQLFQRDGRLLLQADDNLLMTEIRHTKGVQPLLGEPVDARTVVIPLIERGRVKQALLKHGFPVEDLAGYTDGARLEMRLREVTRSGAPFMPRAYQEAAARAFWAGGDARGGSGVLVLPCGSGKTIIGMEAMTLAQMRALIIVTSITAARQWREELLDKTSLGEEQIGEYSGERKDVRPVTIATYQVLTARRDRRKRRTEDDGSDQPSTSASPRAEALEGYLHLDLMNSQDWGLIVYDEVHLLPAPVFRMTAEIQAKRRLGLTATLVREDGREDDVFSLIGPKKADVPWKELEKQGWIATALCTEIRIPLDQPRRLEYAVAEPKEKFRLASTNPAKEEIVEALLERHRGDNVLIIGQYLEQLDQIVKRFNAPVITGKTAQREREKTYAAFKRGEIGVLVVSKVANFSIDLPDANVAIQVSGTFGSRQEEAQRLGRILRPKADGCMARFYSLVTRESRDQDFAMHRQLFLTEQGYRYEIVDAEQILQRAPAAGPGRTALGTERHGG